jgi:hypothetical protein
VDDVFPSPFDVIRAPAANVVGAFLGALIRRLFEEVFMPYGIEELQSGIRYLAEAGEAGRRSLDGVVGPLKGAIGDVTGAAAQLEDLPFVGTEVGTQLQRLLRGAQRGKGAG